ncbi:MAG: iron-sulfur cluster assembly protein [Anaerolineales bacterium]|nr:iron-sulfur cluster assembly protein [Anaerolineales bacterium]
MSDTIDTRKVVWQADSQDASKAEAIRDAMREVIDPEIGLNIIELGLVRDVALEPDKTAIRMILTTPFCPYGPALLEETRKQAAAVGGVPAAIEMGTEMWEPSMMEEGAGADWGLF